MISRILLLDGYSLLYRAFFALPLMDNGEGVYTNALYGFLNMLFKAIETEKPDACAVAFDVDNHTFRHERYSEYKAGRAPTPDEMKPQVELAKELLEHMGIPQLALKGYEADDVLGTVSLMCEEKGIEAIIVTGDRDSYQLAGKYTSILYTKKGISETEKVTPEWINAKYGLAPQQLIDVKALMGDNSDNIPGIKGIGEKTAVKLINDYKTLDELLKHIETDFKGALREKLISGRESAIESRFLAEINRHVPVAVDLDACALGSFENARPLLSKLKLRSILEKLGSKPQSSEKAAVLEAADIKTVDASELKSECARLCAGAGYVAVHYGAELSLANDRGEGIIVPIGGDLLTPPLGGDELKAGLEPLYKNTDIKVIFHNLKAFPGPISEFETRCEDTMLAQYVINPQTALRTVEDVCAACDVPVCACPALSLINVFNVQKARLKADKLDELYETIEKPLLFVLRDMEQTGFRVDSEYLTQLGLIYKQKTDELQEKIYALAGRQVNINSPKQLKQLLFEEMGLPVPGGKKTAASTAADVLEELADDYPICALILEYRKYQKLSSTYVTGLTQQQEADGRIHTVFEQAVTGTGRISSREPNLQNIPVRTELGRDIRRAFIPKDGCVLIDADYSQIELRVLAHMSGDEAMLDAFRKGQDIHTRTASEIFGVPIDNVTHEMRSNAKAVNFGVVYGISEFGLAKNTGVSRTRAGEFISAYFARYPGIKRFMDAQVANGKLNGYVETMFGRRRYLPELKNESYTMRAFGERAAMNSPVQGSAADIIKLAMVRVASELKHSELKTKLILQVHDELIMEAPLSELEEASNLLVKSMQQVCQLSVPLIAEVSSGGNWNECKP